MVNSSPFSIVYNAIWDILHNDGEYEHFIKDLNEVRYSSDDNLNAPRKIHISDADLPELELLIEGLTGNLKSTSSSTNFIIRYAFVLATGSFAYTEILAPLHWILLRNLMLFRDTAPGNYTWQDEPFIKQVTLGIDNSGLSDVFANRGIKGWSSILRFDINMYFKTTDIKTINILK